MVKKIETVSVKNGRAYPAAYSLTTISLTELGKTLVPIVQALCDWGENYFRLLGIPNPCDEQ